MFFISGGDAPKFDLNINEMFTTSPVHKVKGHYDTKFFQVEWDENENSW